MLQKAIASTAILAATFVSGCASQLLSDDRIASETSGALGLQPSQVTITDRRSEMTRTYYTATTPSGQQYTCLLAGGNFTTMGMTSAPICSKKGDGITLGARP